MTVEYTGNELDLDFAASVSAANWWTTDFKDRVTATYYKGASEEAPLEPYDSYTVKLSLKDSNDSWADGTSADKTIKFKVIKSHSQGGMIRAESKRLRARQELSLIYTMTKIIMTNC